MNKCFAGGHLRYVDGAWRDDNGYAVDIEPVRHGEWKKRESKWIDEDGKEWIKFDGIFCSACGNSSPPYNYCPNCGAKMDGKEKK